MPGFVEAVTAVGTAIGGGAAASAGAYLTVASYIYSAYSIIDAQNQQRKAKDAANASLTDRLVTVRSSNAGRRILYGRTRVAADTIAFVEQHGPKREFVSFVLPIAGHEIESIDDILFNDQSIGVLDNDGYVTGGPYFITKEAVQADVFAGGGIGSVHFLSYVPYAVMSATSDETIVLQDGGNVLRTYTEGADYTLSGTLLTWLVDATDHQVTVTYRWNTTAKLVRIKKFLGIGAGERDLDLEANSSGKWTSAHIGRSVARIHVTLQYDNDIFGPVNIPNITCIAKGKKVLDWTTGETKWTNNAALCAADYLSSSSGFGIDISRINVTLMQTAQATCQEWVPAFSCSYDAAGINIDGPVKYVGEVVRFYTTGSLPSPLVADTDYFIKSISRSANTGGVYVLSATSGGSAITLSNDATGSNRVMHRRYTVDGQVSTEANLRDNLKLLTGAMSGKAIYSGGEWRLKAGAFSSPVATIDEDDLADGTISILPNPRRADLFNGVRGTFPDPQNLYQSSSFAPYLSSTYETQDGAQIVVDITLPLTQDAMRAQRIAKRMLFEHRSSLSISANWKLSTFALQTGDTVYVKLSRYGWDAMNGGLGKIFVVGERKLAPTSTIQMSLIETSSAIDAWDYSEATNPDPAPNTTLPDPRYVAQLAGVLFTTSASTYTVLNDGTVIPYALISWDAVTNSAVLQGGRIEVVWKRAPEAEWQTIKLAPDEVSTKIMPLSAGELVNVQIYVYNGAGARSALQAATFVCSPDMAVSNGVSSASGNLLADASFSGGVGQWEKAVESGLTDATSWVKESSLPIAGSPTNAFMYQAGVQAKYMLAYSPKMPVVPGVRYMAFASVIPIRASAKVSVVWYDKTGAILSGDNGNVITALSAGEPRTESGYQVTGLAVTAPTNAASAVMWLLKNGTSSGTDSGAYWLKPFFGPVDANQIGFPIWNAGGAPAVGYDQLAPNSATGIWSTEFPTPADDTRMQQSRRVAVVTFTPEQSGLAELTATVKCTLQRPNIAFVAWQFTTDGTPPLGIQNSDPKVAPTLTGFDANNPQFPMISLMTGTVDAGTTLSGAGSRLISVTAGQTYSIGITVTALYSDFIVHVLADSNTIDFASLKVVLIKR